MLLFQLATLTESSSIFLTASQRLRQSNKLPLAETKLTENHSLTVNEMDEAERSILKYIQERQFSSEIDHLKHGNVQGQRGRARSRVCVSRQSSI